MEYLVLVIFIFSNTCINMWKRFVWQSIYQLVSICLGLSDRDRLKEELYSLPEKLTKNMLTLVDAHFYCCLCIRNSLLKSFLNNIAYECCGEYSLSPLQEHHSSFVNKIRCSSYFDVMGSQCCSENYQPAFLCL